MNIGFCESLIGTVGANIVHGIEFLGSLVLRYNYLLVRSVCKRKISDDQSAKGTGAVPPEPYQWERELKRKTTRNLPQWIMHGPLVQVL